MKIFLVPAVFCLSALSVSAAAIEQVIVRQQWPWSTDVKVEYKLSGVTSRVDLAVRAYNGATELPLPETAIRGDRYGLDEDGIGELTIDPVAAFGTGKTALANFKVKLSLTQSASNVTEVLYKIFCLTNGVVTDVTRAELLNGRYGPVETDFGKIGDGFNTTLDDVIIWTGVTNNPAYKTTHLVMRKIPAAAAGVWKMGAPAGETGQWDETWTKYETQHDVTLTEDYYMGVFEWTEGQHSAVRGAAWKDNYAHPRSFEAWKDMPVGSFRLLNEKFAGFTFGYPTEAQWEFACRAGTTNSLNSGKAYSGAHVREIAWTLANRGEKEENRPVALLLPNAWGLYDMHGNVGEWCNDYFYPGSLADLNQPVDPQGAAQGEYRLVRGGAIGQQDIYVRSACRTFKVLETTYGVYFYGWRIFCKEEK